MRPKHRTIPKNVDASAFPRRRPHKAEPTNKHFVLTERKQRILHALRHGPVPSGLLVLPYYDGKPGYVLTVKKALTDLFHELYEGQTLVWRPDELNPSTGALMQPAVYDLTEWGREVAEVPLSVPRRDHDKHRCMGACIDLSFELLGPAHGIVVNDQEFIFAHEKCPASTRGAENPLLVKLSQGHYEPDRILSFQSMHTGKLRFWMREDDRGSVGFSNARRSDNREKLDRQLEVLERRLYAAQWGVPNMSVMWATTSQARADRMLRYLSGKRHAEKFYFKVLPQFSTKDWRYPKEPIAELFTKWQTVNGPLDILAP